MPRIRPQRLRAEGIGAVDTRRILGRVQQSREHASHFEEPRQTGAGFEMAILMEPLRYGATWLRAVHRRLCDGNKKVVWDRQGHGSVSPRERQVGGLTLMLTGRELG